MPSCNMDNFCPTPSARLPPKEKMAEEYQLYLSPYLNTDKTSGPNFHFIEKNNKQK